MVANSPSTLRETFSTFRSYFQPISIVLILSSLEGMFFNVYGRERIEAIVPKVGGDLVSNVVFSLLVIGIGLVASVLIFLFSTRGRGGTANAIIIFAMLPFFVVSVIFFGETLVLAFAKQYAGPIQILVSMASIYLAIFSVFILISQTTTSAFKNSVFIFYGGIIGGFAGMIVPTIPLIAMLAVVSAYDWLLVRQTRVAEMIEADTERKGTMKLYYEGRDVEIGIGEFISYSTLPAHTFFYFDPQTFLIVLSLIVAGCIINFAVLRKGKVIPGIPIPMTIALTFMSLRVVAMYS